MEHRGCFIHQGNEGKRSGIAVANPRYYCYCASSIKSPNATGQQRLSVYLVWVSGVLGLGSSLIVTTQRVRATKSVYDLLGFMPVQSANLDIRATRTVELNSYRSVVLVASR